MNASVNACLDDCFDDCVNASVNACLDDIFERASMERGVVVVEYVGWEEI